MKEFIKKLIERLEENRRTIVKNDEDLEWNRAVYSCTGIVNQLADEHNNGWIPCIERLPELYQTVLIQYHSKVNGFDKIVLAHIDSFVGWKIEFGGACDSDCVIAWQPLPVPYQPKGE